ncbi:16S rRNA (cytidine(1402)-2'-O)-methyltransferase [Marispirochaeta sp.]|uniref:16S rRNA (cytidine(1402)-2'-O)-methyltransferase n=1 Tax=Marispirochaeta sp. TaxID=2038653 RepID=UPI0029C8EB3A|nr:16S rRNA (cytidine(1402)-2'-O)-methyltransferase [Marispirochaeta sp.]
MGTLYIVATPIGNLGDITFRAVDILKKAELVACEDTRQTVKLLNAYGIHKRLVSCRAGNEAKAAQGLLDILSGGADVAYTSDAGTPGLSDPGAVLSNLVRAAGYPVVPLPGASAFASLISVAGFGGRTVTFDGFLSPKEGRRKRRLSELLKREENFLLYESPFRILKLLKNLAELAPGRRICLGREMTKLHEEFLRGYPGELLTELGERSSIKGEFAIMIEGRNFSQSYGENDDNVSERKG